MKFATVTSGTFSGMNEPFYIARSMYGNYYEGNLREMSFWNYEKTSTQITSDMSTTFTGSETGLVGYWPMTSSSTPGNDLSTANHDATMTNGPVPATDPVPAVFLADIRQSTDYSPFGVILKNRDLRLTAGTGGVPYRYGFNSMEKDDEVKGSGNSYTTEFRQYDPRLGRWLTIDPKAGHPALIGWSPYHFAYNNPIIYTDEAGDIPWPQVLAKYVSVTSEQGYRIHPIKKKRIGHGGMDISAPVGTEVRAMADGIVRKVGWDAGGYGRYVVIQHDNGYFTLYAHLEKSGVLVKEKQEVDNKQPIATSGNTGGSTGPHLHLEVIQAKSLKDIYDYRNKRNPRDFGDLQDFLKNGGIATQTENIKDDVTPLEEVIVTPWQHPLTKSQSERTGWENGPTVPGNNAMPSSEENPSSTPTNTPGESGGSSTEEKKTE